MFMMIPEKAFAGLSVVTLADLLQLSLDRGKLIFSKLFDKDSMKHLLHLQLSHLCKDTKLTEVVSRNNKLFFDLLNKIQVGNIDNDIKNLLKARFTHESDENYPKNALHMYAENEPAMKRNDTVLNDLPGEIYPIEVNCKILNNSKCPLELIQVAKN